MFFIHNAKYYLLCFCKIFLFIKCHTQLEIPICGAVRTMYILTTNPTRNKNKYSNTVPHLDFKQN